ncbi:MAG TPA: adenylate/guanylate cyclase domain-containing protein, partial [Polyangia bacterium]|nr:adenylate/guanylate cyclase domain-containing protein [Polyangia bacterium]
VKDHARHACEAALAMRQTLDTLNSDGRLSGIAIGIGISTGDALVGNMGLESRFDYSAIGDTVNVASRIEGLTKAAGSAILASQATRDRAAGRHAFRALAPMSIRGKREPIPLYAPERG